MGDYDLLKTILHDYDSLFKESSYLDISEEELLTFNDELNVLLPKGKKSKSLIEKEIICFFDRVKQKRMSNVSDAVKVLNNYVSSMSFDVNNLLKISQLLSLCNKSDLDKIIDMLLCNNNFLTIVREYINGNVSNIIYNGVDNVIINAIFEKYNEKIVFSPLYDGSLDIKEYMDYFSYDVKSKPVLSRKEINDLVIVAKKSKDKEAIRKLVEGNYGLVVSIAKKYVGYGVPITDLIQEGIMGLIVAIDRYKFDCNSQFTTYAFFWIKEYVNRAVLSTGKLIRLPEYLGSASIKYKKMKHNLEVKYERRVSVEEMANILGISYERAELLEKYSDDVKSLDEPVKYGDTVPDKTIADTIQSSDDTVEEIFEQKELKNDVNEFLNNCGLNEREIIILCYRYGIGKDRQYSLEEIGGMYGLTRERIRQIEGKALIKMRRSKNLDKIAVYVGKEKSLTKRY